MRARQFGGNAKISLEQGTQLVNTTWKDNDLWLLTTVRPDTVKPKTYIFTEESNFGILEGSYTIREQ